MRLYRRRTPLALSPPALPARARARALALVPALVALGVVLGLVATSGRAASPPGAPVVVWIEIPGARLERVRSLADSGLLPFFRDASRRGALHPLRHTGSAAALDSLRRAIRLAPVPYVDAGERGALPAGRAILSLDGSLRDAESWTTPAGRPSAELALAWRGETDWRTMRHLAGIGERLRPEEVEEFLSMTPEQRRSLASRVATGGDPLWRIRRAYAADKLFANAALLEGAGGTARRIFVVQELALAYEDELLPWTEEQLGQTPLPLGPTSRGTSEDEAAARRLFLHRLRSSAPRVYGRIDRVLHSLASDRGRSSGWILIADASRSSDPFLVILSSPPLRAAAQETAPVAPPSADSVAPPLVDRVAPPPVDRIAPAPSDPIVAALSGRLRTVGWLDAASAPPSPPAAAPSSR
ncbi:MAG: hypothetical protein ACE15D_00695 [Candidatus Eisenbacteria bacterium]